MKQRKWSVSFAAFLAALIFTPLFTHAEPTRSKSATRLTAQHGKHASRDLKKQEDKDTRSDARADMADPSGDYKAYPNWARAALGPKFDD